MFDMNDLTTWLRPSPNVHVGQLFCPEVFESWHRVLNRKQTKVHGRLSIESCSISPTRPLNSCRAESVL